MAIKVLVALLTGVACLSCTRAPSVAPGQAPAQVPTQMPVPSASPSPPAGIEIQPNDNRRAAGVPRGDALSLQMDIGEGLWRPELALPAYRMLAFAEAGRPLVTPGPLIRVREGTAIDATIRNRAPDDIVIHGLHDRSRPPATLRVRANGTAAVRFQPGPAGTYYYWGTRGDTLEDRTGADSQLMGALIVDPRGGPTGDRVSTDERIFVIGHHMATTPPVLAAWVINGRSWPDTERLSYAIGDAVRWRWINATGHRHPLHLHGHYFRVGSAGDNTRDVTRASYDGSRASGGSRGSARSPGSLAVTEMLQPGGTMAMEWSPERAGNWLFHCHILFHVMPDNRLPLPQWFDEYATLPHEQHMSGLVLGIHANGSHVGGSNAGGSNAEGGDANGSDAGRADAERVKAEAARATAANGVGAVPRRITLRVGERPGVRYEVPGLKGPGLGYGIDDRPITAPGPVLTLERAQPVEITILNRIAHATSVHWHGIELESYYDGVPHWGGDSRRRTPYIEAGDSFVARFTPPRAGTFIYHTHFNDYAQLSTGLYGALLVLDPGQTRDPAVDHVFIVSRDGLDDEKDPVLLNGAIEPPALTLRAGVRHRLRIIGITPVASARVRLLRGEHPVAWRAVAKDGADLPPWAATRRPADFMLAPGETYDFELVPEQPGDLRLEVLLDRNARQRASTRLIVSR